MLGPNPVHRIGLGAMQLAGPGVFGPPADPAANRALLRRAVELGVDHIDTAQYYGPDVVNDLIRDALHPYPDDLRLVTKVGALRDKQGGWYAAQRPEQLRAGVEDNLRSLRVERMDLVNLRLTAGGRDDVPLEDQLGELELLRREGKLELIGISNVDRATAEQALALSEVAGIQNGFSVLDRSAAPLLELCAEREIPFVPFFPLGSRFTGGPAKLAENPALQAIAAKHDATTSQVALAWLLHLDQRILLIPGTSSVVHLEENLGAARIELDAEDMQDLAGPSD